MVAKNTGERNYLLPALGGLFLVAIIVLLAYSFSFGGFEGCVGVVEISGPIVSQDVQSTVFSDGVKGADTIAEEIEAADSRPDVKSVLVLVDSPGGSSVASTLLHQTIRSLNKSSVAYINEMGASAGYQIAAGTDYIIANPDAITGSIGARITFADMSRLFEKLGYNETSVKSGAMKDMGSPSREITPEERAVLQSIVDESFASFRASIEESRRGRLDMAGFQTVLDGRILSGRQAKKIGLVDALGNKKDAIRKAAELGGIKSEKPALCDLSTSRGKNSLFGTFSSEALGALARNIGAPRLSYQ